MTLGLVVSERRLRRCACSREVLHTEVRYRLERVDSEGSVFIPDPHLGPCGWPCVRCEPPPASNPEQGVCRGEPFCRRCAKLAARR